MNSERREAVLHQAEMMVLGAILLDYSCFSKVNGVLSPDSFSDDRHKAIFAAYCSLQEKRVPIDPLTVKNEITQAGKSSLVAYSYVSSLCNDVVSAANVEYHAAIVNDYFVRRSLKKVGERLALNAESQGIDILSEQAQAINALQKAVISGDSQDISAIGRARESLVELRKKMDGDADIVRFGNESMDAYFGPADAQLMIVGGRPSMGKTALGIWLAHIIAAKSGFYVPFFSLEMSNKKIGNRELSMATGIPYKRINTGQITETEWIRLNTAADKFDKKKVLVRYIPSATISAIRSHCEMVIQRYGRIGAVVVDYLQMMDAPTKYSGDTKNNAVGENSRQLKILSEELGVIVIVLCQLNRDVDKGGGTQRKPVMSDIRDSGEIEQNADSIIFPVRWEYYDEPVDDKGYPNKGRTEIVVAKNRNGETGSFWLASDIATNNYGMDPYRPYTKRDAFEGMDVPPETDQPF